MRGVNALLIPAASPAEWEGYFSLLATIGLNILLRSHMVDVSMQGRIFKSTFLSWYLENFSSQNGQSRTPTYIPLLRQITEQASPYLAAWD